MVANKTLLTTMMRPENESLVVLQLSSFFLILSKSGAICCVGDNSIPTWQPRYLTGVPRGIHLKCASGDQLGGSSCPIQKPIILLQLILAPEAMQKVLIATSVL